MTKKETNNRDQQNEFIALLQKCINAFSEADKLFDDIDDFIKNKMPNETSKYDSEQQDFLHIIESYDLTDNQLINIGRAMEQNRDNRRNWHNIYEIAKVWNEHKGKVYNRNNRVFLTQCIKKVIENLDHQWEYRVLSEEEISHLLKQPVVQTQKTGKKGFITKDVVKKVLELKNQNVSASDTAKMLKIGTSTVYKIRQGTYKGIENEV